MNASLKSSFSPARFIGVLALGGLLLTGPALGQAQSNSRTFPETGHSVSGQFLTYWDGHGGLAQQGYPISQEMAEKSDLNGQNYTVQYFERAVFEKHPENQPPFDTLLSQLGTFRYQAKYASGAPDQHASTVNPRKFTETGHTLGGVFRTYWEGHGGLAQQGFPISDEFTEKSDLNGQNYTVQYFERAVFELHPENQPPYNVLLSQLGTFQYKAKYSGGTPTVMPAASPTTMPAASVTAIATSRPTAAPTALPTQAAGGTTQVREFDFDFAPANLTIATGSTVTWTNEGPTIHTVGQKNGNWSSDVLQKGDKFSRQFPTAGTYTIYCTIHPLMQMTLTVR